jgi:hypothetical protein
LSHAFYWGATQRLQCGFDQALIGRAQLGVTKFQSIVGDLTDRNLALGIQIFSDRLLPGISLIPNGLLWGDKVILDSPTYA